MEQGVRCLPSNQAYSPGQSSLAMMTGLRPDIAPWSGKIKHIIIIFQENRTLDNMFNGYPGADTQSWGLDHNGKHIPLIQVSETAPYDVSHAHSAFTTEYANGKMNGFDLVKTSGCGKPGACPPPNRRAYGMVPRSESKPYWDMANEWVLADEMFQTNQGPSFPGASVHREWDVDDFEPLLASSGRQSLRSTTHQSPAAATRQPAR